MFSYVPTLDGSDPQALNESHSLSYEEYCAGLVDTIINSSAHKSQAKYLVMYMAPIILLFGILGNILVFPIVKIRFPMTRTETTTYIRMLAVSDLTALVFGLFRRWITAFTQDFASYNIITCKVCSFLASYSTQLSAWIIIGITVERFIAVVYPLRSNEINSCSAVNKYLVVMVLVILFVINLPIIFLFTNESDVLQLSNVSTISNPRCRMGNGSPAMLQLIMWTDLIVYSLLPFAIIIALNSRIILEIKRSRFVRSTVAVPSAQASATTHPSMSCFDQPQQIPRTPRRTLVRVARGNTQITLNTQAALERKITNTLLAISFSFLVLTSPYAIIMLIKSFVSLEKRFPYFPIIASCSEVLMYSHHSVQFYIYTLSKDKSLSLLPCLKRNRLPSHIYNKSTSRKNVNASLTAV